MNRKIVDYKSVYDVADDMSLLDFAVREELMGGWQPYGQQHVVEDSDDKWLVQVMVKYADEDDA